MHATVVKLTFRSVVVVVVGIATRSSLLGCLLAGSLGYLLAM